MIKFDFRFQTIARFLLVSVLFFALGICRAGAATLKAVTIGDDPGTVTVSLSEKVPYKVIRVDGKEVLIALKNIDRARVGSRKGKSGSVIREVAVEELPGGVTALVVTGSRRFDTIRAAWDKTGSKLVVRLKKKGTPRKAPAPAREQPKRAKRVTPVPEKKVAKPSPKPARVAAVAKPAPPASRVKKPVKGDYVPVKRAASIYQGDINDILIKAKVPGCRSREMERAVNSLKKGMWEEGGDLLDTIIGQESSACLEPAYYLRAYAGLMGAGDDASKKLAAVRLFQDALVAYPDSELLPFALAGMGILQNRLKNPAAAEGYFAIIRDSHREYPGLPQVLYHLGRIYEAKGYNDQALAYYKEVYEKLPENSYMVDAGLGVGKILFKKRFYIDSLNTLTHLLKSNPEKTYDSPELLRSIGDANFELGRTAPARENLTRVLNLFPDIKGKDMILARVAETYAIEKNVKRAESIYRLVIEAYPGGEGYLNCSMGLAILLKDLEEKKKIYSMVKEGFPDHKLASVAMIRLAEIYEQEGEYAKCIEEIENLLATHPRGMRYEAVKLMQRAYEALFDKQLKQGSYPEVLERFEKEHVILDRMESRKVYLSVGLAYLEARLHEQAFNQLIKAYKLYKRKSRPEPLLFALGVAMDETGRRDDALRILTGFIKRYPKSADRAEASVRIGNILTDKKQFAKAARSFDRAYGATGDRLRKGKILAGKSNVYKAQNDWSQVSNLLARAARELAMAPGNNFEVLSTTYTRLGESYLEQKLYVKAADAFVLALKFGGGEEARADIGFMLGDAYQKANVLKKARKAFEKVVALEDSIWSRLAKERLATLDLAEKVKNS
ncbi:MAG: tetratricopeptide repeat protein [Desulfobacteraceae bacterium]|nr:tetratricopeptide repeat protein [Desulfobacteraceae bacterium]